MNSIRCRLKKAGTGLLAFVLALTILLPASTAEVKAASSNPAKIGNFQPIPKLEIDYYSLLHVLALHDQQVMAVTYDGDIWIYDGRSNSWTKSGQSPIQLPAAAALLKDGRVLLIGGEEESGSGYNAAVIYDPKTGNSQLVSKLPGYILNRPTAQAVTMEDGNVLLMGSYTLYGQLQHIAYTYDPEADEWQELDKMVYTANELVQNADGLILNYGGGLRDYFAHGHLYDPASGELKTISSQPYLLRFSAAAPLADGSFLLAGGSQSAGGTILPSVTSLVFLPERNEWRRIAPMREARAYADAVLLPDGRVLAAGGIGVQGRLKTTEIYHPAADRWDAGPMLHYAYEQIYMVQMSNGDLAVIGSVWDGERQFIAGEILRLDPRLAANPVHYDLNALPAELRGTLVMRRTLFEHDGWIYQSQYMYEEDVNSEFGGGTDAVSYTRMYMTRRHQTTGVTEIVIDGRHRFLRTDGDVMYYIQDSYLKKMKLGERYGELLRFPRTFRVEDPRDPRRYVLNSYDQRAERPINLGAQYFDGEYIYTWWPSAIDYNEAGYPVRIHYTGGPPEVLSDVRGTEYRGDMQIVDGWILYLANSSEDQGWNWNSTSVIHAVRLDGSEERDLAVIRGDFQVIDNRIYYRNAEDLTSGIIPTGKLYAMNADGSNKVMLSAESSGELHVVGDDLIFETFDTGTIIRMSKDGTKKQVLLQGTEHKQYHLYEVTPSYIVYNVYTGEYLDQFQGTYKMYLSTMRTEKIDHLNYESPIRVYLNGRQLAFPQDPVTRNQRVLVPMRVIFEALGAKVNWDPASGDITAVRGTDSILIRGETVYLNGERMMLDQPPIFLNQTTLVPIRFISQALGAEVTWVGREKSVYIILEP